MNIRSWFFNKHKAEEGNGLYATIEELMAMRRYVIYAQGFKKTKTYSRQAGDIKSAFKGRGMELEEIRSYDFGDDVRDINWRVTARKDAPYTNVYNEEKDREIYVWLDLSAPMLFGTQKELKSVTAAKLAALIGWLSLENKDRFGCVIFDGNESLLFKPKSGRAALLAILKKISQVGQRVLSVNKLDVSEQLKSLKLLEQNAKNKATTFVLSDFNGFRDEAWKQLAVFARKSNLYLMNIYDVLEEKAPRSGEYLAEYNGKRLIVDSSAKIYRHDYLAYFAKKKEEIRNFCKRFGCKEMSFRTDLGIVDNLKI